MAKDQVTLFPTVGAWLEGSDGTATSVSFQTIAGEIYMRKGGSTAPDANLNGWKYSVGEGERGLAIADVAAGTGDRIWFRAKAINSSVVVDHA